MICKNCEKKSKKSFCSDYCERIFKNFPFNCLKCNSKLGFGKNKKLLKFYCNKSCASSHFNKKERNGNYGNKQTLESNLKRSQTLLKGHKIGKIKYYRHSSEIRKKISINTKLAMQSEEVQENIKKSFTLERRRKIREARLKQIKKDGYFCQIGKNEKCLLDQQELDDYGIFEKYDPIPNTQILKSIKYKILRQYPVAGYVVDGYCPETNTVYEVYEPFHYKNEKKINKDLERQKRIQKHLNCLFIIIEDYMFPEL
jgi:hypothetical protein